MALPGRKYTAGNGYRYGFNGKENDPETSTQDYGLRIYDGRVAKFLSVDPIAKEYPWNSTYAFSENTPIQAIDLEGKEKYVVIRWYENNKLQSTTMIKVPVAKRNIDYKDKGVLYIEVDGSPASLNLINSFFVKYKPVPNITQLQEMSIDPKNIKFSNVIKKSVQCRFHERLSVIL